MSLNIFSKVITVLIFFIVTAQAEPFLDDDDFWQDPCHKEAINSTDTLCPPCVQAQNIMSVRCERLVLGFLLCQFVKLIWDFYPCREPIGSVPEANKPAELKVDLWNAFPTESEYRSRIHRNFRDCTRFLYNEDSGHLEAYLDRGNGKLERLWWFLDGCPKR